MKRNIKGESIIGIIVGVVILSIVVLGIINVILYSETELDYFDTNNEIINLEKNTQNIITKLDVSNIAENEEFYIYKNTSTNTFETFTGITYEGYKYIDKNGDYISNTGSYIGNIYSRILSVERRDDILGKSQEIIDFEIIKL